MPPSNHFKFTADSVITLHDPATGEPVLAVIVEPQGRDDASSTPGRPTSPLGMAEGAIRAKAEDILKVLDARHLKPTKEQRGQVNAATDLTKLDRWFDRALTAATAAEIFAD
jgi:hypothetical protein